MTSFHNTVNEMIMEYLKPHEDIIIDAYYTKDKRGNVTNFIDDSDVSDEIHELVSKSCNYGNFDENYDFDLSTMSADTVLYIQKELLDEYELECIGDSLFKKEHLIIWYMLSGGVIEEIKGMYETILIQRILRGHDTIKIQKIWRGYSARLKAATPNMALLEARYGKLEYHAETNDFTDGDGFVRYMVPI